jgi:hypothetical protein
MQAPADRPRTPNMELRVDRRQFALWLEHLL